LTRALALTDQHDAALQVANQAAAEFPDSPRLQAQPGWVQYYAKRYDEAEQAYRQLLERWEDQPATLVRETLRDARLVLSNIGVQRKQPAQAEEWLEQVLDEFPEDAGALNDLGYLWADQGKQLKWALEMTRRAVDSRPDNVAYRDSFGWVLFRLGRISEAIRELEQAVAGDAPDGVILDHLGDAYQQAERKADAVAMWRRAVAAFAKEGERDKERATQQKIERCEK
jgi:tetratricopeptide (TPR) repeat protein